MTRSESQGSSVNDDIARTPLPTAAELRRRKSVPRQAVRFVVLNLKIFKLTRHGH